MSAGRRLALIHQAMGVWLFMDDKIDLTYTITQFIETGAFGGGSGETMPYNPEVLQAIVSSGLWTR